MVVIEGKQKEAAATEEVVSKDAALSTCFKSTAWPGDFLLF